MRRGFTLIETLIAAGIIVLVGMYVGRLAVASREAVAQGQRQTRAAHILARLGAEAQRGNPQVVPVGSNTTRSIDEARLTSFLGRNTEGYRGEVRASGNGGLRDYAVRVCWADGCVEGSVKGPAPIAGVVGTSPTRASIGRGTLEVLVEGGSKIAPDVHVSGGNTHRRIQRWGLTRLEGLPSGSYTINGLGIRSDRYTYEAPAVAEANLDSGEGSRVVVRYQPTSGAISVGVTAPEGATVSGSLGGPSGVYAIRESVLIPYLPTGTYTLSAPAINCGDYICQPRLEGSPVTLTAGETKSLSLAYGYASGNIALQVNGVGAASLRVRGPAGYERTLFGSTLLRDLVPGTYTVDVLEVRQGGYTYQAEDSTLEVRVGQTTEVRINYVAVTGRLRVRVEAPQDGVLGRVTQDGQTLHSFGVNGGEWELLPARYGVEPVAFLRDDFRYEAGLQGVQVEAGRVNEVVLSFQPVTAVLDYRVSSLPTGQLASAHLDGPRSFQTGLPASRLLTGLGSGNYRFRAQPVEASGYTYAPEPAEREMSLTAGQRYSLNLNYVRQEGRVNKVGGLPENTTSSIGLGRVGQEFALTPGVNAGISTAYAPENRAALNLTVFKNYSGSDSRFINNTPEALWILQNGSNYYQPGLGSHSTGLWPGNIYSLNRSVGYEYEFASSCGVFGCFERFYWKLQSVNGLPLVPWAGEIYNAQAVWRRRRCA